MSPSPGNGSGLQSEINVTPLVDVCLVMLIIFMVVTPMITNDPRVLLPSGSRPGPKPEGATQRAITVTGERPPRVLLDSRSLSEPELTAQLAALFRRAPQTEIVLKADRRLVYRDVKRVFRMARGAGFTDVGVIAEQAGQSAED